MATAVVPLNHHQQHIQQHSSEDIKNIGNGNAFGEAEDNKNNMVSFSSPSAVQKRESFQNPDNNNGGGPGFGNTPSEQEQQFMMIQQQQMDGRENGVPPFPQPLPPRTPHICDGCHKPIHEPTIFRVHPDMEFHDGCLRCIECQRPLDERCTAFVRDAKVFCRDDYFRRYARPCVRCGVPIHAGEYVHRVHGRPFHVACFSCANCERRLERGDQAVVVGFHPLAPLELFCRTECSLQFAQQHHAAAVAAAMANGYGGPPPGAFPPGYHPHQQNIFTGGGGAGVGTPPPHQPGVGGMLPPPGASPFTSPAGGRGGGGGYPGLPPAGAVHPLEQQRSSSGTATTALNAVITNGGGSEDGSVQNQQQQERVHLQTQTLLGGGTNRDVRGAGGDQMDDNCNQQQQLMLLDGGGGDGDGNCCFSPDSSTALTTPPSSAGGCGDGDGAMIFGGNVNNANANNGGGGNLFSSSAASLLSSEGSNNSSSCNTSNTGHPGVAPASGVSKSRKHRSKDRPAQRMRTVLNDAQLRMLKQVYTQNPRPDQAMKDHLQERTGLNQRVIRVWFQNRRCKDKKRQILQHQQQQLHEKEQVLHGVRLSGVGPLAAESPQPLGDLPATAPTLGDASQGQAAAQAVFFGGVIDQHQAEIRQFVQAPALWQHQQQPQQPMGVVGLGPPEPQLLGVLMPSGYGTITTIAGGCPY